MLRPEPEWATAVKQAEAACEALRAFYGIRYGGIAITANAGEVDVMGSHKCRPGELAPPAPPTDEQPGLQLAARIADHYHVRSGTITLSVHQERVTEISVNHTSTAVPSPTPR